METMKQRLASGEKLVVFAVGRMFHPNIVQYLGMMGDFDGFWIDTEHAGLTTSEVEVAVMAGRAHGLDSFVRIPPTDYATVTRIYESGSGGVMASQILSAEHAEQFVRWAKFAPRGSRGLNALGYDGGFGSIPIADFARRANEDHFVAVQIETAGALAQVDDIAAIDGIDLLFVGPSDLSQALGITGDFMHPDAIAAVDRVAAACKANGKTWGAVTPTPAYAEMAAEKGCTLICPTNDVKLIAAGLVKVKSDFAAVW